MDRTPEEGIEWMTINEILDECSQSDVRSGILSIAHRSIALEGTNWITSSGQQAVEPSHHGRGLVRNQVTWSFGGPSMVSRRPAWLGPLTVAPVLACDSLPPPT